jgi:ADP-L-glycero-D-manno-heptose 6-epimerase
MKILLTGYDGFIGSHLKKELSKNHKLILVERDSDRDWVESVISECDVVVHQGAISDTMNYDVNEMMAQNFEFSKFIFDIACNKKIIYASSAACYGPKSIYAWSKYCAEQYGLYRVDNFIALRYFNVYGPGEEHKGAMASVALQAMKKKSMELFPKFPKRDFVFIGDIVDANIHAIVNEVDSGVYDVGTSDSRSFEDVCDILGIPYTYKDESDIPKHYQYHTKADFNKWLPNWKPKYNIEDGLRLYEDHFRKWMF